MDDKVKHRIVGLVVMAVFLVILIPALLKNVIWHEEKSDEQPTLEANSFDSSINDIKNANKTEAFQTSHIAHVSLDSPAMPAETIPSTNDNQPMTVTSTMPEIQEASVPPPQPVQMSAVVPSEPVSTASDPIVIPISVAEKPISKPPQKPKVKAVIVKKIVPVKVKPVYRPVSPVSVAIKKQKANYTNYCIQMGAFANPTNAQQLLNRLKAKGFVSTKTEPVTFSNGKKGQRVVFCRVMTRNEAVIWRNRLAHLFNTNAIIVKQG